MNNNLFEIQLFVCLMVVSLIIKYVVRKVNLPSLFTVIASNLFYVSRNMIRSNGFMPTIYVLY